jgi:hypothetical protein
MGVLIIDNICISVSVMLTVKVVAIFVELNLLCDDLPVGVGVELAFLIPLIPHL